MKYRWLALLVFALVSLCAHAKVSVSVVTSYPSDREVYTLWGHTALLVESDSFSRVYNYGVFEFDEDFVYKFVSGQTDYRLDEESPRMMMGELKWKKSPAYAQILNLTDEEAAAVAAALKENLRPENAVYRYKFFSDNCATRPQRLVERCVKGIVYEDVKNRESYRDITHRLCASAPWLRVGIDVCLGSEADKVVPDSGVTFLPVNLMSLWDHAKIVSPDGTSRPLVKAKVCLFPPALTKDSSAVPSLWQTPLFASLVVLLLSALAMFLSVKGRVGFARGFGGLCFLVAGALGCLVFYLTFFSTHECTSPNFNLFWLNPLHLVTSVLLMVGARNNFSRVWLIVDLLLCACYLLLIAPLPQTTCVEFVVLSITLIISLLAYLWNDRRFFLEKFNKKTLSDKQQIK